MLHDEHSELHWNHIRQGRVGGWRDEATPRQLAELARLCGGWLVRNGYEHDAHWLLPSVEYLGQTLDATQQELRTERAVRVSRTGTERTTATRPLLTKHGPEAPSTRPRVARRDPVARSELTAGVLLSLRERIGPLAEREEYAAATED